MKIGILGGGQLGRMLIQNALNYDDEWFTLDPAPDAPCAAISRQTIGDFSDYETVFEFGRNMDVVTVEIEHVNAEALEKLEQEGIKIIPSPAAIKMIQRKTLQKDFYRNHNIPTPDYQNISKKEEITLSLPFVQKTDTGGYDGKGVQVIKNEDDLQKLWDGSTVVEKLVDIKKELSVIVAIGQNGQVKNFPVTEMVADPALNLLDYNVAPAEMVNNDDISLQIEAIAEKFAAAIQSPGLFAIELFLDKNGTVWVNETAPRLHNSGHLTQEGNSTSQFEQLYRILKNYPLGDTAPRGFSGMLNLVGAENEFGKVRYMGLENALAENHTYVHLYGKTETKPGRKMGHINVLGKSRAEVIEKLSMLKRQVKVISCG